MIAAQVGNGNFPGGLSEGVHRTPDYQYCGEIRIRLPSGEDPGVNPELDRYAPFVKYKRSWVGGDVVVKWGEYDQGQWPDGPRVLQAGGPPPFLVREYQAGPSLEEMAPLSLPKALETLAQILSTLDRMHRYGIIHGRLKPTNVFSSGLTDPGLGVEESELNDIMFRAPELTGTHPASVGPPADLYSVGACLCFMLTGHPPYRGRDLHEAVRAPFHQPLPSLLALSRAPSEDQILAGLDSMMARLMSIDADERYGSAGEALADLRRLQESPESFVPGKYEARARPAAPAFVGRHDLLDGLKHHLERGGILQLVGAAGSGKSRLAEQARRMAQTRGGLVLRGRARQQMADAPLQVFDEVCQELLSQREPGELARVLEALGEWRAVVAKALPALGVSTQGGPDAHAWTRTRQAMTYFLQVLGTPRRPALLILEDLHWSAPDILEILAELKTPPYVAVLVTSRRELALPGQLRKLEPLPLEDVERMARSMLGRCHPDPLGVAIRTSEGSPYRLVSLLKRWTRQGTLKPGSEGWTAPKGTPTSGWLAPPCDEVDEVTREVLFAAAVVGREVDFPLLTQLFEPEPVRLALQSAVAVGLLHSVGPGEWSFAHDLAREAVLRWRPEFRKATHSMVASALRRRAPLPVQDLAYHLHHAGELSEAVEFARLAASQARDRSALSTAETYLLMALAGAPGEASLWEELGDVQRIAGRFEAAERSYRSSLALVRDRSHRARILGGQADAAFGDGRLDAAGDFYREALTLLGHTLPRGRWLRNLALTRELVRYLLPSRGSQELEPDQRLAASLLDRLAYVLAYTDGHGLVWANLRCLNLTRGATPGREIATALITHAVTTLFVPPLVNRSRKIAKQALDILEQHGTEYDRAMATARAATIELFLDSPAEAARMDEWVVPVMKRSGDRYDAHMSTFNLGTAYYFLGRLDRAREVLRENLKECLAIGDSLGCGYTMKILALLDHLTEDEVSSMPVKPASPSARMLIDEVRAIYHLQKGQFQLASEQLEQCSRQARRGGDVFQDMWTALFLIRARRLQSLREQGPYRSGLETWIEKESARILRLIEKGYKVFAPRACRELALLKVQQGHAEEAQRLLKRGLKAARECGMLYEEALALSELAELARISGRSAEPERSEAARLFRLTGSTWERSSLVNPVPVVALAERFDQVVFWTQAIASSQSFFEVVETTRQAAESMLRCRSVRLLGDQSSSHIRTIAPRESTTLSALVIPLPWAEEAETELYCVSEEAENHFGEEEIRLATLIQGQARVASSNVRLWHDVSLREAHLERLFSCVPVGIAVVDRNGFVRRSNPRLQVLLGQPNLDKPLYEYFQSRHSLWLRQSLREIEADRLLHRELRLTLPDGRLLWGELSLQSLPGAAGEVIVVLADVSGQRLEQIAVFQDRERHLLSSEVHDVLSQPLVALQLQMDALARQHQEVGPALKESSQNARAVLDETRNLIARLRSPHIEQLCLTRAIEDAVSNLLERGCQVGIELDPQADNLSPLPALFAYRIVVEALTNCGRHAQARRVGVRLRVRGPWLYGIVADDGTGFVPAEVPPDRFGLRILCERAEIIGGRACIRSSASRGTAVSFRLPTANP